MAPKNPMQRKATNSFILGMFTTLLIAAVIVAFLILQLNKIKTEKEALENNKTDAIVITADVKSGDPLAGNFAVKKIDKNAVPSGSATSDTSKISADAIAKVDMPAGTVLSPAMISQEAAPDLESMREQEYNMIILPSELEDEDYIDVRLKLPSGLDFIVVAKKQIKIPELDGNRSSTTIRMNMNEAETLALDSAIVDFYIMKGSLLYATKYTDPGNQKASTVTYTVEKNLKSAIEGNANVKQQAANAIVGQWREDYRKTIQEQVDLYKENSLDNIEAGLEEQVTKALEERKAYLNALSGTN